VSELSTDPILGWRLWQVRHDGEGHRLESFTWHHIAWPALARLEARCAVHRDDAPARGHECGIHAFATRELAEGLLRRYTGQTLRYYNRDPELPDRNGRPVALGRVSLWGRVLAREFGFRAQYAYPYELFLIGADDDLASELRGLYAVDVSPTYRARP
jgi:hypothetical protein